MFIIPNRGFCANLTSYEKKLYQCSKHGDSLVLGVAIVQAKNRKLTKAVVRRALSIMWNRHPLLAAYLEHDTLNDKVYLINNNDQDLEFDLEWSVIASREKLTYELEQFNNKLFNYKNRGILWRCKVIKFIEDSIDKYAVSVVLPLFMTDGINISTISIEIVNIINAILTGTECEEMKTKLELIDNLHVLTSKYKLYSEKQKKDANLTNQNCFLLSEKFQSFNEKGLKISLLKINKELSKKLITLSKEKKCKLTGFLNACILYALRELYLENGLKFPCDLSCGVPANLRLRYKPNLDFSHVRFQVCLTRYNLSYPIFGDFKDLWSDASYINNQIEKCTCMEDGSLFSITHANDQLEDLNLDESDLIKLREANHFDLILSNIGTYVSDRKKQFPGPFQIKELYHGDSQNSSPNIIAALIFHVCSWNDELQILLSSNKHSIGSAYIDRLVYLIEKIFINSGD